MMRNTSTVVGTAWIAISCALLVVLSYEPAHIVTALDLEGSLSEAVVVILGLATVAVCSGAGVQALRNRD